MTRSLVRPPVLIAMIAVIATGVGSSATFAQPSGAAVADPVPPIRRIDVPADDPGVWPPGDWVPFSATRLKQALEAARAERPAAARTWIADATYEGTLASDSFRQGTLSATITSFETTPVPIVVDGLGVALETLIWSDNQPVTWGTDDTDRTVLFSRPGRHVLSGRWTLPGRSFPGATEFQFRLLPAAATHLVLRLPKDRLITANVGQVESVVASNPPGWTVWRLALGSHQAVDVTVAEPKSSLGAHSAVHYTEATTYRLREGDLRFLTNLELNVRHAPLRQLAIQVPVGVDIYSISYGADSPLRFHVATDNPAGQVLTVELPGPLLGTARPIRVSGLMSLSGRSTVVMPQLIVEAGVLTGGSAALTVESPLEVVDFRTRHMSLVAPVSRTTSSETFQFQKTSPEASLSAIVRRPRSRLTAQVFTRLTAADEWVMDSELLWVATTGDSYRAACELPPGWDVTDVTLLGDAPRDEVVNWEVETRANSVRVNLEFLRPVSPRSPKRVRLLSRRPAPAQGQTFPLPGCFPLGCESVETLLGVTRSAFAIPRLPPGTTFDPVSAADVKDLGKSFVSIDALGALADDGAVDWYHSLMTRPGGTLIFQNRLAPVDVQCLTIVGSAEETYVVDCEAIDEPVDRVLIYLTRAGADLDWQIAGLVPEISIAPVISTRIPPILHQDWGLPLVGELWEVRLPAPRREPFQLIAKRQGNPQLLTRATLPAVPQAGTLRRYVAAVSDAGNELTFENKVSKSPPALPPPLASLLPNKGFRTTVIECESSDEVVEILSTGVDGSQSAWITVSMHGQSLLSSHERYAFHHAELLVTPERGRGEYVFELPAPAELISVTVNGASVEVIVEPGGAYRPSGLDRSRDNAVAIVYRTPQRQRLLRTEGHVIAPRLRPLPLQFSWSLGSAVGDYLQTPSGTFHSGSSDGDDSVWTERLFGPLGRTVGQNWFNPLFWTTASAPPVAEQFVTPLFSVVRSENWKRRSFAGNIPFSDLPVSSWNQGVLFQVSMTLMLASAALYAGLRFLQFRYRDRACAAWLFMWLATTFTVPAPWTQLTGAVIVGTIIVMLLPRRLFLRLRRRESPTEDIPTGSTHNHVTAAIAVMLSVWFFCGPAVRAQDRTASETAASPERFEVLVPFDRTQPSAWNPSLVHVSPDLAAWSNRQLPAASNRVEYLIRHAAYTIDWKLGKDYAQVEAFYEIVIPTGHEEVRVELPLADANPGGAAACIVDGRPTPVVRGADESSLIVTLPAPDSQPVSALDAVHPDRPAAIRTHRVRLQLHPRAVRGIRESIAIRIPPVASAVARSAPGSRPVVFSDQIGTSEEDAGITDAVRVGPVNVLHIIHADNARPALRTESDVDFTLLAEVGPTLIQARMRQQWNVKTGGISYLEWELPADTVIDALNVPGLLRWRRRPFSEENSRILIEFDAAVAGTFQLDATLLIPVRDGATSVRVPDLGRVLQNGTATGITVTKYLLGLTASNGRLTVAAAVPSNLMPAPVATDILGDGTSSRPDLLFQGQAGSEIEVELREIPTTRGVILEQKYRIDARRINWTATAAVTTTGAPAFAYHIRIPPRARVDALSVIEDGAERLQRWTIARTTPEYQELVAYLTGRSGAEQQVVLTGHVPLNLDEPVPLPTFLLPETIPTDSRVVISASSEIAVELLDPSALEAIAVDRAADDGTRRSATGTFRWVDPQAVPLLEVTQRNKPCFVSTVTTISQADGHHRQMRSKLVFRAEQSESTQFRVRLTDEMVDATDVAVDSGILVADFDDDQGRVIVVESLPSGDVPVPVSLTFTTEVVEPAEGRWILPEFQLFNTIEEEHYLVVVPDRGLVVSDPAATAIDLSGIPPGLAAGIVPQDRDVPAAAYYSQIGPWLTTLPPKVRSTAEPGVLMMETRLQVVRDDEQIFGETVMALFSDAGEVIKIALPPGCCVESVVIDDDRIAVPPDTTESLELALEPSVSPRWLLLRWTATRESAEFIAGRLRSTYPRPIGISVQQEFVSVVPPAAWLALPGSEWQQVSRNEPARLSLWLGVLKQMPENAPATFSAVSEIRRRLTASTDAATGEGSANATSPSALVEQLDTLRSQLDSGSLGRSLDDAVLLPIAIAAAITAPQRGIVRSEKSPASDISMWWIDRRILHAIILLTVALLAMPVLARLVRWNLGSRLAEHPAVSCALLGLVWWVGLRPSGFGFAVFCAAVAWAVSRYVASWKQNSPAEQAS